MSSIGAMAGADVFHKRNDDAACGKRLAEAVERVPMRRLAHCLMPNHFHWVVWTLDDGDVGR